MLREKALLLLICSHKNEQEVYQWVESFGRWVMLSYDIHEESDVGFTNKCGSSKINDSLAHHINLALNCILLTYEERWENEMIRKK